MPTVEPMVDQAVPVLGTQVSRQLLSEVRQYPEGSHERLEAIAAYFKALDAEHGN